jgi:protein-L-isoaspartate(D-aspartate) O-methyltransferase
MISDSANVQMVSQQVRAWDVLEPRVLDAMAAVSRESFAPQAYRGVAFVDAPIPLDHGQEMLPPNIVGRLLQSLSLLPSDSVLEIGTGSGYVTACLAYLGGHVLSIDIYEDFTAMAATNLAPLGRSGLTLETRDAMTLDDTGRFDAIAVTGSLPAHDPRFQKALTVGGRLFVIVGEEPLMEARLVTRVATDQWVTESLFETVVPPLVNASKPAEFTF